jgi:hypothetical protein
MRLPWVFIAATVIARLYYSLLSNDRCAAGGRELFKEAAGGHLGADAHTDSDGGCWFAAGRVVIGVG